MQQKPRTRIATDQPLEKGALVTLEHPQAHQLAHVLRAQVGEPVALFNRTQGEWWATIRDIKKKAVLLEVAVQMRQPVREPDFTVCFAPIKGGRLETIIEKATELGATALQPVLTQRTIVDKVNLERADAIAREAAEQCERLSWPAIYTPVKLPQLLGSWPADRMLIYGDETGQSKPATDTIRPSNKAEKFAILVGPEGGFTTEELAMLGHCKAARGVGLGPRILRADTAVITLAVLTLSAWGDWDQPPRFHGVSA